MFFVRALLARVPFTRSVRACAEQLRNIRGMRAGKPAALLLLCACACLVGLSAAAEKCPPADFRYEGLYLCWDADAIAAFDDLSVSDQRPVRRNAAIFSGPNKVRFVIFLPTATNDRRQMGG